MLLGNMSVLLRSPGRSFGGVGHSTYRSGWGQPGASQGQFITLPQVAATPPGYRPPYGWGMPIKSGELVSNTIIVGLGLAAGAGAGGRNGEATIAGVGAVTAVGQTVASLIAALAGSGLVSDADMRAVLDALATLAGSSTLTADVDALAWAEAAAAGVAVLTLVPYATGLMGAEILPGAASEVLTPGQIADAVWEAAVASYQTAGTMGEVQDNGSGSFPGGQFWP